MKKLELTHDLVALVDDEDYVRLSKYNWSALFNQTDGVYAVRSATLYLNDDPELRIPHPDLGVGRGPSQPGSSKAEGRKRPDRCRSLGIRPGRPGCRVL